MGAETVLGAPLVFLLELVVLYAAGSYAMGRLVGVSGFHRGGAVLGRAAYYLLVLPGVVLHESAHYLACVLTGTEVSCFAPFSPHRRPADDHLVLGYVRHERRAFPVRAVIGFAPVLVNPLGLLLVTALLTPLTFREVANPSLVVLREEVLSSGFLTGTPLLAAVWAYLSLSFALGSVPSREDLAGVPAALVLFCAGALAIYLFGGNEGGLARAIGDLSTLAAGLYALPATVAAFAALAIGSLGRTLR